MNTKKIILVIGATGAQGGSLARALLADGEFAVRMLTRDTSSPKAIELERAGAEVVYGDMNNIVSLKKATQDCYGVYGVTSFWEHFEKEYLHGKNLIDAVKASGISHFVFHTLPDYNLLSNGEFPTPHCDIKAALQQYTNNLDIPASFVHIAFYYENFFNFFPLQKADDGFWEFGFPQGHTPLAMLSIEDLGGIVLALFKEPSKYIGRVVGAVGADDDCAEYAAVLSRVLDKKVRYRYVPRSKYAALGFPGARELANMFEVQRLFITDRKADLKESYSLNPCMQSFESWVRKHKVNFLRLMNSREREMV